MTVEATRGGRGQLPSSDQPGAAGGGSVAGRPDTLASAWLTASWQKCGRSRPEKPEVEPERWWAVTPRRRAGVPRADGRPCHPLPPWSSRSCPGTAWAQPTVWLYSPPGPSRQACHANKSFSYPGRVQGLRQGIRDLDLCRRGEDSQLPPIRSTSA